MIYFLLYFELDAINRILLYFELDAINRISTFT